MPYYENPGMLREQYVRLRALPPELKANISVIVTDDGSPTQPAIHEDTGVRRSQLYRIKVDIRWNQDAARNIGVKYAKTDFVLMTDIDHIVPQATWEKLIKEERWRKDYAYSFHRKTLVSTNPDVLVDYKPHPNSWFISKELFERVGGYDERFAGYYGTDGDFKVRMLELNAKKWIQLPEFIYRVPRETIPDASTTTYKRKQPDDRPTIYKMIQDRKTEADQRPRRYRFPYERVA